MTSDRALDRPPGIDTPFMLRRDLVEDGWHDRAILANIRSGLWTRVRQGAYVETVLWNALDVADKHLVLVRAVVRQSCTELVVSHASAVPVHRGPTWGLDLSHVHGTRRDGKAGRKEAGVRQHRGVILEEDVERKYGIDVFTATRTALEVTTVANAEVALVVVNHFLHSGATTLGKLRARYELGIHRWPWTLRTDLVLRRATSLCESIGESRLLHLCAAYGLPRPVVQFEVRDESGRVRYRVDLAWPELGIFIEFDGRVKYTQPWNVEESAADVVLREKRREDEIRELTGWLCLRVTWADLDRPEQLVARIQAAFERARKVARVS